LRILELEISNIRGIHNLLLKPNGNNLLIWGPNGSGKSAVVDAVDFLLTGKISRLTGEGTGNITLKKHGPHIDHKPNEATVRAIIQLPNYNKPIELKRCIAQPHILIYNKNIEGYLNPILNIASQGQYVLTRRDILRYITSDPSTRAEEIQELLNITNIERIRKTFVKVKSELKNIFQADKNSVEKSQGSILSTLQIETYDEKEILHKINTLRLDVGGKSISTIRSSEIKRDLKHSNISYKNIDYDSTQFILKDIQNINEILNKKNQTKIEILDKKLRSFINTIKSDPKSLQVLSHLKLVELGITNISKNGSCPLCDTSWPRGKLHKYLKEKISLAESIKKDAEQIDDLSSQIANYVNKTITSLQNIINIKRDLQIKDKKILQYWLKKLQILSEKLSTSGEKYPDPKYGVKQVKKMLAPKNINVILNDILIKEKKFIPEIEYKRVSWDILTQLEENLKALERDQNELQLAKLHYTIAEKMLNNFQTARDTILENLYDSIKENFVKIYKQLHGKDEKNFTAKIKSEGAGLNVEVDFYERGTFPPNAMHSEGHQDSMGLCLYLALSERLNKDLVNFTILDDVMMSIDSTHRREVCRLLKTNFSNHQFIITTHDKNWAYQLKSEGVVNSKEIIEFYNWQIDTGPQINYTSEMWEKIEEDLSKNDVPSAAAKLRRGSEEFFSTVCENLKAKTIHKLNAQWELGELLPAAIHQYNELLNKAKSTASSWGNKETVDMLNEVQSIAKTIFARTNSEQWPININVHYNNWGSFTKEDFRPVVEAFNDLFHLFICNKCNSLLHLSMRGQKEENIRCNCGYVNWNLMKK